MHVLRIGGGCGDHRAGRQSIMDRRRAIHHNVPSSECRDSLECGRPSSDMFQLSDSPKSSSEGLCGSWSCVYDIELINPALVLICGVGLPTRHVSSGASGVPRRVKVERRRQKQVEL